MLKIILMTLLIAGIVMELALIFTFVYHASRLFTLLMFGEYMIEEDSEEKEN